jgi:hypothetical protein
MWTKRPYGQIAKCAEAQALRKAFPEMTGSQPTADEMEGKPLDYDGNTIDGATGEIIPQKPSGPPPYPEDAFQRNLTKWRESGTKTPAEFIAMLSTKGTLSAEQIAAIKNTSARSAEGSAQASDGGSAGAAAASTVATGEMSEAEIAEARARELKESQQ